MGDGLGFRYLLLVQLIHGSMLGIIEYSQGGMCVSLQLYISALQLVRISIVNLVLI